MLRIHHYAPDGTEREATLQELAAVLGSGGTTWVDMLAPTDVEFGTVSQIFGWHPLAIEDCLVETHLPKVDDYGEYLLLVLHAAQMQDGSTLKSVEMEVFLSRSSIVTHRREPIAAVDDLADRARRNAGLAARGPAFLLYLILDAMEEVSVPYLDTLDQRLDDIDAEILDRPSTRTLVSINKLKREVSALRRFALPQAEVVGRLGRGEFDAVPSEASMYFRDIHDELFRISQMADSYRDLLTGSLDAYLSAISNNLNSVMKVLTVFASLMMPVTFLAGVWGMNFRHMPELEWRYGYAFAWGVIVAVGVGLIWFFRRRRWL